MTVTLEILENDRLKETRQLDDGHYTIGRDPSADIVLNSKTVSKNHATLIIENGSFRVTDNGSANGVFCRGEKISEKTFKNEFQIELTPFSIRTATKEGPPTPAGKKAILPGSFGSFVNRNMATVFAGLIALVMLFTLLIVYVPLKNHAEADSLQERLKNGIFLCRHLAEINRPFLETGEHALVSTATIREEKGVLYAFVVDSHGRIIAPHENQGDFFNWNGLPQALREAREKTDKGTRGETLIFNPVNYHNRILGAAIIGFSAETTGTEQGTGLGGGAVLLLLILFGLAVMTAYLLARNYLNQLKLFYEDVEVAIKEGRDRIAFQAPNEELDQLKRIINRLLLRKTSGGVLPDKGETPPAVDKDRPTANKPAPEPAATVESGQSPPPVADAPSVPAGLWCLINTDDYTLVQISDTFTRDLRLKECRQGMHIIEAFDSDIILVVTQIIENTGDSTLETAAAGKKFRVTGTKRNKDKATVLILFEEME